jgi:hypothetical protein
MHHLGFNVRSRSLARVTLVVSTAALLAFSVVSVPAAPSASAVAVGANPRPDDLGQISVDRGSDFADDARRQSAAQLTWKWPGDRLTFWSGLAGDYAWSLRTAVKAWNKTGLDMTLVQTRKKRSADVQISATPGSDMAGETLTETTLGGRATRAWIKMSRDAFASPDSPSIDEWHLKVVMARILAHEFGHVLGQHRHEPESHSCGLMEATHHIDDCADIPSPGNFKCGMVDDWVLNRLVKKYGGRRSLGTTTCPLLPEPPALDGVRISGGMDEAAMVSVAWQVPPAAAGNRVELVVGRECSPVGFDQHGAAEWDTTKAEVHLLDPGTGSWTQPTPSEVENLCYAVRLVNEAGAGRAPTASWRMSYVPSPPAPRILSVEKHGPSSVLVRFVASSYLNDEDYYEVFVDPPGQCRASVTWDDILAKPGSTRPDVDADDIATLEVGTGGLSVCLSMVAYRYAATPPLLSPVTAVETP